MGKRWTKRQQKAHRRLWIKALRSGEYKQGRGRLMTLDGGFCCLGVACDISGLGKWESGAYVIGNGRGRPKSTAITVLPDQVKDWLGLTTAAGGYGIAARDLTYDNDRDHKRLTTIANIIEREPKGLVAE